MEMCAHFECDVEFGILHHKHLCSGCGRYFCDAHVCDSSYVSHLSGEGVELVEKGLNEKGDLCAACLDKALEKAGISLVGGSLRLKTCSEAQCGKELNGTFTSKKSCVVCGRTFCSKHISERKEVDNRWLVRNERFKKADGVCSECKGMIDSERYDNRDIYHEKALNLRLVAGSRNGRRKAILVHGILSDHRAFDEIGRELVRCGAFDVAWALDDSVYQGRVNEAKLGWSDFITVPNPASILKSVGFGLAKEGFFKALKAIDLPAYIVEGTAKNLALTLRFLGWKDVTLIGHSLGGIVARCAVESYALSSYVGKTITLGSPFRLWLRFNKKDLANWEPEKLNHHMDYLAIVGKDDWVVLHRSWGNLTEVDAGSPNVLKILIDGADHTSIHSGARFNNVAAIIKSFVRGAGDEVNTGRFRVFQKGDARFVSDQEKILGMSPVEMDGGDWCETSFSNDFELSLGMSAQQRRVGP